MMSRHRARLSVLPLALFTLLFVTGGHARADVITLDAVDSGHYDFTRVLPMGAGSFSHSASDKSYEASSIIRVEFVSISNNYFVFDLSGITGQITSAQLVLSNPATFGVPSAGYTLFDVSTPIGDLVANQSGGFGSLAQSIFNDLGGGTPYSSQQVISSSDRLVTIPLNDAAVEALTAEQGHQFAIGGAITSGTFVSLFLNTGQDSVRQLVIEVAPAAPVPEPTAFALLGIGTLGLLAYGRRRRKRAVAQVAFRLTK
jgi:hypothetical protein